MGSTCHNCGAHISEFDDNPHVELIKEIKAIIKAELKARGNNQQRFLTVSEAAEYLRLSETALRSMVARREIDFYKLGNRIRFDIATLKKALIPYPSIEAY